MPITNLSIPFEKKDELKQFKIRWNNEKKTWYFDGAELPEELKKYVSKYVIVSYDDKDDYKLVYKSMSFDTDKKMWKMSVEDFEKFLMREE